MIEILEGVFYDPSKEWYDQPQELIILALELEKTTPIDMEMEVSTALPTHARLKWAVWEHTTEMGTFRMRVDIFYLYSIDNAEFLSKAAHNRVTIEKIG